MNPDRQAIRIVEKTVLLWNLGIDWVPYAGVFEPRTAVF